MGGVGGLGFRIDSARVIVLVRRRTQSLFVSGVLDLLAGGFRIYPAALARAFGSGLERNLQLVFDTDHATDAPDSGFNLFLFPITRDFAYQCDSAILSGDLDVRRHRGERRIVSQLL